MATETARSLAHRHPLQRLQSPSLGASAVLHVAGLASFAYSFSYLIYNPHPFQDAYGWHFQFLTIIGLALASATFTAGLLADVTGNRVLFNIKNGLSVASAPMECLISMLYWGIRAIDPALVQPPTIPPLPLPTDLSFHAIPSLALVADLLFVSPPYAIRFLPSLLLSTGIAFGYWWWVERCFSFNNFYPYPLFAALNTTQRIGLFAFSALLMALSTATLIWLYSVVNGKEEVDREKQGKAANGHAVPYGKAKGP